MGSRGGAGGPVRSVATTPGAILALVLLLASLVSVLLDDPALARLAPLPAAAPIEHARHPAPLAPLDDAYVRRVLGLGPDGEPAAGAPVPGRPATTALPVAAAGRPGLAAPDAEDRPVTVAHPFTNDDFEHAYPVASLPFSGSTTTRAARRQPGEPATCSGLGGTAWYRYTSPRDQTLFADTFGTGYADALGVFTGSRRTALRQVACASSTSGAAQTGFAAERGTTYWFQVAGTLGGGRLAFHLTRLGTTRTITTAARQAMPVLSRDGRSLAAVVTPLAGVPGSRTCLRGRPCPVLQLQDLQTGRSRVLVQLHPQLPSPLSGNDGPDPTIGDISMSADGRWIAFDSDDAQLVPGDTNGEFDVFVVDTRTARVERVSLTDAGRQAVVPPTDRELFTNLCPCRSGSSRPTGISADGRFVAFTSVAALVADDRSRSLDVYVRDRRLGRTRRVSDDSGRTPAQRLPVGTLECQTTSAVMGPSSMSDDGRWVVWHRGTTGGCNDGYPGDLRLWDATSGRSRSVVPRGASPAAFSYDGVLSGDGSTLAMHYAVDGTPVAPAATITRIGLLDLRSGRFTQVPDRTGDTSTSFADFLGPTGASPTMRLSTDGRYLALASYDPGLVPGDTNGAQDVFLYDRRLGTRVRVSTTSTGGQFSVDSYLPTMSADGRTVAFLQGTPGGGLPVTLVVHRSTKSGAP